MMGNHQPAVLRERKREDVAWAAGLFEGEGSFSLGQKRQPNGRPRSRRSAQVSLSTADEDVARRFAEVIGFGRIYSYPQHGLGAKPIHQFQIGGFHRMQAIVAMLWPWLGERRRARAKEILAMCEGGPR